MGLFIFLTDCSFVNYHSLLCLCVNQASHANLILINEIGDDDDDDDDGGLKVAAVYCICVVRSLGVVWTCDISVSAVLIRQAAPTLTTPCTAGYCRTRTLRFMSFTLLTAVHAGCLQLLEICWNLVDSPGKFYNWQCNFYLSGDFLITLYIGSPRVNRITMFSGVSIPAW